MITQLRPVTSQGFLVGRLDLSWVLSASRIVRFGYTQLWATRFASSRCNPKTGLARCLSFDQFLEFGPGLGEGREQRVAVHFLDRNPAEFGRFPRRPAVAD